MDYTFSNMSQRIKQRAVIEFLTQENVTPIEIHRRLSAVYGDDTIDKSTVRRWVRKSRESDGRLDIKDRARSGRPLSASRHENKDKINTMIRDNRFITQRALARDLNIGLARINVIIQDLGYQKIGPRWFHETDIADRIEGIIFYRYSFFIN